MREFDEYFNKNFETGLSDPSVYILRHTFEAGAQSKQAEIDDHIKRRMELAKEKKGLINERDELRKRIDDALVLLDDFNCPQEYGIDDIDKAIEILKGTTNEQ